jgi:hypothetical protein
MNETKTLKPMLPKNVGCSLMFIIKQKEYKLKRGVYYTITIRESFIDEVNND